MDAIEAIHSRRSIRDYTPDPVARDVIEDIVRDSTYAPWTPLSGSEPWAFNIIQGRERIARYGDRAKQYALEHRPRRHGYGWADDPAFSIFHNAPVVIVISGREDYSFALEECTRAGQVLTLSAHARGLGTCWVGSPGLWLRDSAVRRELGIPDGFIPCATFTLGHPAAVAPRPAAFAPRMTWLGEQ